MKRLTAWLAGAAGGLAAYRLLHRRPEPATAPAAEPPAEPPFVAEESPDPRAAELRARLEATRVEEAPEPEAEEPQGPEERRRAVHEEARSALDEMRGRNAPG